MIALTSPPTKIIRGMHPPHHPRDWRLCRWRPKKKEKLFKIKLLRGTPRIVSQQPRAERWARVIQKEHNEFVYKIVCSFCQKFKLEMPDKRRAHRQAYIASLTWEEELCSIVSYVGLSCGDCHGDFACDLKIKKWFLIKFYIHYDDIFYYLIAISTFRNKILFFSECFTEAYLLEYLDVTIYRRINESETSHHTCGRELQDEKSSSFGF